MKKITFVVMLGLVSAGELAAQSNSAPAAPSITPAPAGQAAATEPAVRLDVANFCCPEYIVALRKSVAAGWQAPPNITATTTVQFVIERDGQITKAEIERPSGVAEVDLVAMRAVRQAKPGPLPTRFDRQTLTVHLTFVSGPSASRPTAGALAEAIRSLQRFVSPGGRADVAKGAPEPGASIQFDTQGVEFGPWVRRFVAHMRRNWFIPPAATTQRGRTVVTFWVSKAGAIRDVTITQPSGVAEFDRSAFNAVVNANPLEALPPAYPRDEVQFTVTFYYNEQPAAK